MTAPKQPPEGSTRLQKLQALARKLEFETFNTQDEKIIHLLARQYRETLKDIAEIEAQEEHTDELTDLL